MAIDQVHSAIESYLRANWHATDLAFENAGYEPRSDGDGAIIPWVLVEIQGGLYEQVSLGAGEAGRNFWIEAGSLWLHVFVGSGTGSLIAKQLAAQLADLFRGLELAPDIEFGDITIAASGGTVDGNNWSISVSVDWSQG